MPAAIARRTCTAGASGSGARAGAHADTKTAPPAKSRRARTNVARLALRGNLRPGRNGFELLDALHR
ncbi:MAG: hypothetical protein ACSLFE_08390, partial [Gemmatimonadaceae bacterium]